jgi:sulfate adenylyltransferase subunit 2
MQQERYSLSVLSVLEAESIHILREVAAECERPVMMYSVGKDSSTMVRLAQKAFHPGRIPFPLLHIDTSYKFPEMYDFRDRFCNDIGADLRVYRNEEALAAEANPWDLGTVKCCALLKTQGLLGGLRQGEYDAVIGGARREEERSRAKERIYSFRDGHGQWDPKNQRPELWNLYNGKVNPGESIRVFPLSNWTELDIWQYIHKEKIEIVPLYFAKERPVVWRDGQMIMVDDDRMRLLPGETAEMRKIRFRTLGCYPLTGAIDSGAETLLDIVEEMLVATSSERQGRVIDKDQAASMEKKKQEGYF